MKLITWNVQRLEKNRTKEILEILNDENADILILTETNSKFLTLSGYNHCSTMPLPGNLDKIKYKDGENRVSIFSKFPIIGQTETWNQFTCICIDLKTPFGTLTVYGTIIGIEGGIGKNFKNDLRNQIRDFGKLSIGKNFCLAGDLNIMLSDRAYPSHEARQLLNDFFNDNSLICLTSEIPKNVNHICINETFVNEKQILKKCWNEAETLSDHKGICITITDPAK